MGKNRWLAAVLNLLVWGGGYFYLEQKKTFAKLVILGWLVSHSAWIFSERELVALPLTYRAVSFVGFFIVGFAFGYDAYQLAKEPPTP